MPLYDYLCPDCGKRFEGFARIADSGIAKPCPECGAPSQKAFSAPAIQIDYAGYSCPITGKWIEGRKAHAKNLAQHGCRVLECGEVEQAQRASAEANDRLAERVAETAAEFAAKLSPAKREQLGRELEGGLDISIERN